MRLILQETRSAGNVWTEADFGPILRHQMNAPIGDARSDSFTQLLNRAQPDAGALRAIKEYAKNLRNDPSSGFPTPVATALYYAAIVAAQCRAGTRISELDDARLREGAAWALTQPWLTDDLRDLFTGFARR